MAEPQRERKRRKWDVAAPVPVSSSGGASIPSSNAAAAQSKAAVPTSSPVSNPQPAAPSAQTPDIIAKAKMGAMSVLEKINKDLRAKGSAPMKNFGPKMDEDRIRRDVFINDAPGPIRYNLTRRVTQDDIARRTGTQIVVRGQYQPPGVPITTNEPPLFLKVTPGAVSQEEDSVQQYAVDVAAGEVQHIVNGGAVGTYRHNVPPPASVTGATAPAAPPPLGQFAPGAASQGSHPGHGAGVRPSYASVPPPGQAYPQQAPASLAPVQLYINISAPQEFGLASRLRGPGDSYLGHIAGKTAAEVVLRGTGSGMVETSEPLHILVSGSSQRAIDEAFRLAKNLIDTVREDFQKDHPSTPVAQPQGPPPAHRHPPPPGTAMQHQAPQQAGHMHYPQQAHNPYGQPGPHMGPPGQPYSYGPPRGQPPGYAPPQNPGHMYPPASGPYMQAPGPQPYMNYGRHSPHNQQWPGAGYPPSSHPPAHSQVGSSPYQAQSHSQQPQVAQQRPDSLQQHPTANNQTQNAAHSTQPAGRSEQSTQPHLGQGEQPKEGRRRFKEVKEAQPAVPSQPAPYAPAPMGPPAPRNPTSMGPPPPKTGASMGPPPPRNPTAMGPPPPRPAKQQGSRSDGGVRSQQKGTGGRISAAA